MQAADPPKRDPYYYYFLFGPSIATVILFVYAFGTLFWGEKAFYQQNYPYGWFLAFLPNIVFINFLHVFMTYSMYLHLPELKRFRTELREQRGENLDLRLILLFLGFMVFLMGYMYAASLWEHEWQRAAMLLLVLKVPQILHTCAQFSGFNSIFSVVDPSKRGQGAPAWQKRALIGVGVLYLIVLCLRPFMREIEGMVAVVSVVLPLCMLALFIALVRSHQAGWQRPVYLLRTFVYSLSPFFQIPRILTEINHGSEYLYVYRRMSANSDLARPLKKKMHLFTGALMLFGAGLYMARFFLVADYADLTLPLLVLAALPTACSYLHFYMDARLFRMKDPLCREHVAPMINKGFIQ